jgi:hypothetical protein
VAVWWGRGVPPSVKEVALMRRILLVLTAAMVMALTLVAMALPAFAGGGEGLHCTSDESGQYVSECRGGVGGGGGGSGGGFGGKYDADTTPPEGEPAVVGSGGGGFGGATGGGPEGSGGGGGRCEYPTYDPNAPPSTPECTGGGKFDPVV